MYIDEDGWMVPETMMDIERISLRYSIGLKIKFNLDELNTDETAKRLPKKSSFGVLGLSKE